MALNIGRGGSVEKFKDSCMEGLGEVATNAEIKEVVAFGVNGGDIDWGKEGTGTGVT